MSTPVTYGNDKTNNQFEVTYPDVNDPSKSYSQKYYTKSVVKEDTDGTKYSETTLYRDPWGTGSHENVGTIDSRTNIFQASDDASDSQAAYFSTPNAKNRIRSQALDTIYREKLSDLQLTSNLSDAEARESARLYANQSIQSNSADAGDVTREISEEGISPSSLSSQKTSPPPSTYTVRGVSKPRVGTMWKETAFSKNSKTLIYPEDHSSEEFDYIKITPIEYVPALSGEALDTAAGTRVNQPSRHYNINVNDEDWFGFKSIKKRYLRTKQVGSTIFLPMSPQGLSETNGVKWGESGMNAIQTAAGRLAFDAIGTAGGGAPLQAARDLLGGAGNAAQAFINNPQIEGFIKAYFAGKAVNANLIGRAGIAINPNLEVLFDGPMLRQFNYNFIFTPRTQSEAVTVRSIIKVLKKTMAPKRRDKIFLSVPAVYKIRYVFNGDADDDHPWLNKIKPCALSSLNVSYAPDGYMTYQDGSMTSYAISMRFDELEPIYNDDIKDVDAATTGF